MTTHKLAVLIILDGWGIAQPGPGNAITEAKTPFFDSLLQNYPNNRLLASGESVGLPHGEFGNSETGHFNIGAGYIVPQDVVLIDRAIADGSFFDRPGLLSAFSHIREHHSRLHLMGLMSEAKVHSSLNHLFALLRAVKDQRLPQVYLHLFTDGRDSPPNSAQSYLEQVMDYLQKTGIGRVKSIIGRFYAMDRDQRWLRTQKAYDLLTVGKGYTAASAQQAIDDAYRRKETDEFISPTAIATDKDPFIPIDNSDAVIFFNFRFDRPRQLTRAFVDPKFAGFQRVKTPEDIFFATMTPYAKDLPASTAIFEHLHVENPLARVISQYGLPQLHLAESEKFPHVTYFLNGGREEPFEGEDWIEIPSPKVTTYDQKPEMSAGAVSQILLERIASEKYNFIAVNFANPDMVAHTGNIAAGQKAVEAVDRCLQQIVPAALKKDALVLIISDHGNIEMMKDLQTGNIDTQHNTSPVPCIAAAKELEKNETAQVKNGSLADVAPTLLSALGIPQPSSMTGQNLLFA